MDSTFRIGSRLSSGSVRFVTRHTAFSLAAAVAGGAALLGLVAGIAIGMHWRGGHTAQASQVPDASAANRVERAYTIDRLGSLSALVAQFEPRIERLSAEYDRLRDFEARLNTPRRARGGAAMPAPAAATSADGLAAIDSDAAGGPALPPRRCGAIAPTPDARLDKQTDAGRDVRGDARADLQADARAGVRGGIRTNARLGERADVRGNARTDARADIRRDARTDERADVGGDAQTNPQTNPQTNADSTRRQLNCFAATLAALEQLSAEHLAAYAAYPGRMPANGARFGSPFGNRSDPFTHRLSFHPGVDLVAAFGTPIVAAAGGRVVFAGEKSGYGNAVEIDHGNGFVTRYGHASRIVVRVDDLVLPRQHIADVGSTGRSTGPHLHFEVLVGGAPVDPAGYLALFVPPARG